jgi:hypothetical protein
LGCNHSVLCVDLQVLCLVLGLVPFFFGRGLLCEYS